MEFCLRARLATVLLAAARTVYGVYSLCLPAAAVYCSLAVFASQQLPFCGKLTVTVLNVCLDQCKQYVTPDIYR